MLKLITAPIIQTVTLRDAKEHLRIDVTDQDYMVQGLVEAATAHFDGWSGVLGRALMPQTWEMTLDAFPVGDVKIPLGPVTSLVSIKYDDENEVEQTVSASAYSVNLVPVEAVVRPVSGWPGTADKIGAVRVRWNAGTGCPLDVAHAIKMLVAHWYLNTEAAGPAISDVPMAVGMITSKYRRVGV